MSKKRQSLILSHSDGRLGNQLFFFANSIAFALEHDMAVLNPSFFRYAQLFHGSSQGSFATFPAGHATGLGWLQDKQRYWLYRLFSYWPSVHRIEVGSGSLLETALLKLGLRKKSNKELDGSRVLFAELPEYEEAISKILSCRKTFLSGYMFVMNDQTMKKHQQTIRDYFQLRQDASAKVLSQYEENNNACDILIGVHIRRGDYRVYRGGKYFFEDRVYRRMMEECLVLFSGEKVRFLIFSDEAISMEHFTGLDAVVVSGTPTEDMYLMAKCARLIGPSSTFTKWASFVGNVPLLAIESADQQVNQSDFQLYYNH